MTRISDIARALEAWAPPSTAQSYDRVGLQIGDPEAPVARVLVALDLTPAVVEEAERTGADLIITHHPVLFHPLEALTTEKLIPAMALRLARSGIACFAAHTNLDAAAGGVSFALAEQLGILDARPLELLPDSLVRVEIDLETPLEPEDLARLEAAGAGEPRFVDGRIEMEAPAWTAGEILALVGEMSSGRVIRSEVLPLTRRYAGAGLGVVGMLAEATSLGAFLDAVCRALETPAVRYAGRPEAPVRRVAVCGGSGSSLVPLALEAGADAYVTADVTYHTFFDVLDPSGRPRMALVDAGHYPTEAVTEELLCRRLRGWFPDVLFARTSVRTDPVHLHVGS